MRARAFLVAAVITASCAAACSDPCSEGPPGGKPMCPAEGCYTCEDQRRHQGCFGTCAAQECWTCSGGEWRRSAVDCDPRCATPPNTPDGAPLCPDETCYTCEHQRLHPGCFGTCHAQRCWKYSLGTWQKIVVDCESNCP